MNKRSLKYLYFIIAFLLLLICSLSLANDLINLDLHDESYSFVKRMIVKYQITKRIDNTRPILRREIAQALLEISEKHQSGQIKLTDVEKNHLEKYQWLFSDEIKSIKPEFLDLKGKKGIITIGAEDYKIKLNAGVGQEFAHVIQESKESQNKYITTIDLSLQAKLGKHIGVYSILHDRFLVGKAKYNPYETEKAQEFAGKTAAINTMEGYLVLASSSASIQWGLNKSWWGPGWHGALMISDNSAASDNLKITGLYGPIRFTYLTAILRERNPEYQIKYMSAHRLEFTPYKGIGIGLSESVVFADHYELRYLNPFTSFYISQFEDFRNNGLVGFDFDITILPSIEFYGELMVDDLQPSAGAADMLKVWNSKYGILGGIYLVDPFKIKNTDARVEYAFVNQYAYAHRYDITRYTNQDYIIGHWMGPDSDNLWLNVGHWLNDKIRASMTYELVRHGEWDVKKKHPFELLPGEKKPEDINPPKYWEFLSGITETTHSFSPGLSYASIGRYSIALDYTYSLVGNAKNKSGLDEKNHLIKIKAEYKF